MNEKKIAYERAKNPATLADYSLPEKTRAEFEYEDAKRVYDKYVENFKVDFPKANITNL